MNANVQSYLGEIWSNHDDSLNFLQWMIDTSQVDLLTCALLVNSKFNHMLLVNIKTPMTSCSLLHWTMFSPDMSAISKAWAAAGGNCDAQILLGELPKNLDHVDISIHVGTHFLMYNSFMTLLTDIAGILSSMY